MANPNANSGLVGHWIFFPDPEDQSGEYSQIGQITLSVGDHHLVRIHPPTNGVPPFSRLMTSDALTADGIYIFTTKEELEAWMWWTPDGGLRVVSMRKPT